MINVMTNGEFWGIFLHIFFLIYEQESTPRANNHQNVKTIQLLCTNSLTLLRSSRTAKRTETKDVIQNELHWHKLSFTVI